MSEPDNSLIAEFNARRSEAAFAALVRQHVNLVFATALRQVGDAGAAEEITQNVFVALAQAAGKLGAHPTIAGWLHQTALNKSREWLRSELRRRKREQVASNLDLARAEGDSVWSPLVPLLDEALLKLCGPDRQAVILHFMEGRTFYEVGSALGIGEDTARKRVNRCLEQLTQFFRRRGFAVPALAAGAPLFTLSSHAAPAGLAVSATTASLAAAHSAASTSTLTLIKGALKIMAWTKAKTAIVASAVLLLAAGTTTIAVKEIHRHRIYPSRTDSGMAAAQTARAFFETLNQEDWNKASGFWQAAPPPVDDRFKNTLGGLEVVSVGQPFVDPRHARDLFVPYAVRFKGGGGQTNNLWLWQDTLENRRDSRGAIMNRAKMGLPQFPSKPDGRWYIVGGF